ncbi:hypothetical protein ACHAXT_001333 [Thalassiosira profunda]
MSNTLRILLQIVALCLAASLAQGSPPGLPSRSRQLQPWLEQDANLLAMLDLHTKGPDDSCHLFVATEPDALDEDAVLATGGNGVVFAVQSDEGDDDGVAITGLGFHVDQQTLAFVEEIGIDYEVYALSVDGGPFLGNMARGNMAMWTKIAEGQIHTDDLTQSPTGYPEFSFYQIPPGSFRASVPPNGGVRSFLIQTRLGTGQNQLGTLVSVQSPGGKLNDAMPMKIANVDEAGNSFPRVLLGEQFGGYPMPQDPFAYERSLFMGVLYYETECPTSFTGLSLTLLSPPVPSGVGTDISFETTPAPADDGSVGGGDTAGFDTEGSDSGCHLYVTSPSSDDDMLGAGILFPVQSDLEDDDGVVIAGLEFHVLRSEVADANGGVLPYEVFVLSVDGLYASPERDANSGERFDDDAFGTPLPISANATNSFDYRGEQNIAMWTKIAEGEITLEDLSQDSEFWGTAGTYSLPPGAFRASVPPNGGVRSFFIQIKASGLVYALPPDGKSVNDEMDMIAPHHAPSQHIPRMLVGEGFQAHSSGSMPNEAFRYTPKVFLGRVHYEIECPDGAPSVTPSPSAALPATQLDLSLQALCGGNRNMFVAAKPDVGVMLPLEGSGILFPVQSDAEDDDGVVVTGLDFHVSHSRVAQSESGLIPYEVYALSVEGYYASPERDTAYLGGLDPSAFPSFDDDWPWEISAISAEAANPFDYRGERNAAMWTKIAEGEISMGDLIEDAEFWNDNWGYGGDYFCQDSPCAGVYSIPSGTFQVDVPPNGGIRSFYIQTKGMGLYDAYPPGGKSVNDEMDVIVPYPSDVASVERTQQQELYFPRMLVGESFMGGTSMPDDPLEYYPRIFTGKIHYEWKCRSVETNGGTLEGGLLLSISMKCNEGNGLEDLSEETRIAVVDAVESAAERAVAESNPYLISNIAAELLAAHCVVGGAAQRQLLGDADQTVVQGDIMEFSVLVTADYVPPKPRPGEADPPQEAPDLGAMTETQINRDPEQFARDLNDRAVEASPLAEVEVADVQVESVVVVEDEPLPERFTKAPTPTPGIAQALSAASDGDDGSNVVGIVVGVSCSVVVALLLLGVYLFYAKEKPNPGKGVQADVLATCEVESGNLSDDGSCPPVSEAKRDDVRATQPVEGDEKTPEQKSDEEEGIIVGAPAANVDEEEVTNLRDSAQSRFEGRLMQKLSSSAGGSSVEQSTNASGTSLGGSVPDADVEAEEGDVDDRDSAQSRFEDRLMRKMSSSAERRSAVPVRSPRPASLSGSVSAEQRGTSTGCRDAASFGGSASAEQRGTSAGSLGGEELNRDPQNESFSRFERRLRRKLTGSAGGAAKVSPASLDTDSESSEKDTATRENIGSTDDGHEEPQDAAFSRFERRLGRKVNE